MKYVLQIRDLKTCSLFHDLPIDISSVLDISAGRRDSKILIGFASFLTPGTICHCNLGVRVSDMKMFQEMVIPGFDRTESCVDQIFVLSKDGAKIPMFIIARKIIPIDVSHPCLLSGYEWLLSSSTSTRVWGELSRRSPMSI